MYNPYLIILVAYLLYYAGNIIYDGFLRNPQTTQQQDEQLEYLLGNLAEEDYQTATVQIDDVENLNTPSAYHIKEIPRNTLETDEGEEPDLEKWRETFEAEQGLEDIGGQHNTMAAPVPEPLISEPIPPVLIEPEAPIQPPKPRRSSIQRMMEQAETRVQLVSWNGGYNVYSLP